MAKFTGGRCRFNVAYYDCYHYYYYYCYYCYYYYYYYHYNYNYNDYRQGTTGPAELVIVFFSFFDSSPAVDVKKGTAVTLQMTLHDLENNVMQFRIPKTATLHVRDFWQAPVETGFVVGNQTPGGRSSFFCGSTVLGWPGLTDFEGDRDDEADVLHPQTIHKTGLRTPEHGYKDLFLIGSCPIFGGSVQVL